MTVDLESFLRARLDEDQEAAEAHRQASGHWHHDDFANEVRDDVNAGTVAFVPHPADGSHIARHDPARTLAEIEAKRHLLTWVLRWPLRPYPPSSVDGVLELLALPYAAHPDYREEWRPAVR